MKNASRDDPGRPDLALGQASEEEASTLLHRFRKRRSRSHRSVMWGLRLLVVGGILAVLLSRVGLDRFLTNLANLRWEGILVGFLLLELQPIVLAAAWGRILRGLSYPFGYTKLLRASFISLLFNQLFPAALGGTVARGAFAARWGVRAGTAINSVVIERATNVGALILAAVAAQVIFMHRYVTDFDLIPLVVGGILLAGVGVVLMVERRFRPMLLRTKLGRFFNSGAADLRLCLSQPADLLLATWWGLSWHLLSGTSLAVFLWAIGTTVPFVALLALLPLVLLVSLLPISINGWGVREAAMVGALSLESVPAEQALLASVLYGSSVMLSRTPGALLIAFGSPEHRD